MYYKTLITCILCLLIYRGQAQDIKGKILNQETLEPIAGATIFIVKDELYKTSDKEGIFELPKLKTGATLKISALGYQPKEFLYDGSKQPLITLETSTQELNTVVVTASRGAALRSESPVAISKLSTKLINETKASQLYELINKTPGVVMPSYGNEQHGMSIRQPMGTSPYYLYMEDGVPIRPLGVFNHNALLEVNQYTISSIEVVKGPVSSIYGPEAVGGAINFIMQQPTALTTAKIGVQADNWGFKRIQFGAGATLGKFGFYIGGLSSQQKDSWMSNSDYNKSTINLQLSYQLDKNTQLLGHLVWGDYYSQMSGGVDSTALYSKKYRSLSDFTYRKAQSLRSSITLQRQWKNTNAQSFITVFQRKNSLGQNPSYGIRWKAEASATNDPTKALGEVNENNFTSLGVIAQHTQNFNFLKSKVLAGVSADLSKNDYNSHLLELNAKLNPDEKSVAKYTIANERFDQIITAYAGDIKNYASYLQLNIQPLAHTRVVLGGRYDIMNLAYKNYRDASSGRIVYQKLTPKIGVTYDFKDGKGVYINYAQGFSPPALTSIFRPKPNSNPVAFYTNLSPATFLNYETGGWIPLLKNKVQIEWAVYQMNGRNELLNIRQADNSFDYQSAGKTLHRGIEFSLMAHPNQQISFRYGGTVALHRYQDFQVSQQNNQIQNLSGFEMPNAPRWSWDSEINYYPHALRNFRCSLEWQYLSSYYQNQINTVKYEGYHLLHFRMGYTWKSIELYSNVMNLTNTLYASSVTRGNNATDRSNYNPGAPRSIIFGIEYKFVGKN